MIRRLKPDQFTRKFYEAIRFKYDPVVKKNPYYTNLNATNVNLLNNRNYFSLGAKWIKLIS